MSGKMWGGRFAEATAASVEAFSASIHYDARLYHHDIMGSKAHARMLAKQGLIAADRPANFVLWPVQHAAELAYWFGNKPACTVVRQGKVYVAQVA